MIRFYNNTKSNSMPKPKSYMLSIVTLSLTVGIMYGCQNEKIVQSTEYIEKIEVNRRIEQLQFRLRFD